MYMPLYMNSVCSYKNVSSIKAEISSNLFNLGLRMPGIVFEDLQIQNRCAVNVCGCMNCICQLSFLDTDIQ